MLVREAPKMQTQYNRYTDKELSTMVAMKEDATDLEVELMARLDNQIALVEDLEEKLRDSGHFERTRHGLRS